MNPSIGFHLEEAVRAGLLEIEPDGAEFPTSMWARYLGWDYERFVGPRMLRLLRAYESEQGLIGDSNRRKTIQTLQWTARTWLEGHVLSITEQTELKQQYQIDDLADLSSTSFSTQAKNLIYVVDMIRNWSRYKDVEFKAVEHANQVLIGNYTPEQETQLVFDIIVQSIVQLAALQAEEE